MQRDAVWLMKGLALAWTTRVFIRSNARGEGLGRRLIESILGEARITGYSRICLDVLPEFTAAQAIYKSLGFRPAPPVTFNPVPGTKFLGMDIFSLNPTSAI